MKNDTVELGKYNDIIYLGDSHDTNLDTNEATHLANGGAALKGFIYGESDNLKADSELVNADGYFTTDITGLSKNHVDIANGHEGDDKIYGQGGTDLIYGGFGNDYIDGGEGDDALRGGAGDDVIFASSDDKIDGGKGNDIIDLNGIGIDEALFVDGGEDMDALLVGAGELDSIKDMLISDANNISNTEVIIAGGDQDTARDLLDAIETKGNKFDPSGWTGGETVTAKGGATYQKYFSSDNTVTIFVNTDLLG